MPSCSKYVWIQDRQRTFAQNGHAEQVLLFAVSRQMIQSIGKIGKIGKKGKVRKEWREKVRWA